MVGSIFFISLYTLKSEQNKYINTFIQAKVDVT